ncbi:FAD-dependent thymidylate synthase [Aquifex aeolicus]|nr:FAD-dependent thymidylate synthase [Aquifex aeolicus]
MKIYLMGSDQRIVRCARVSFAKDSYVDEKRDKRLIRYLFKHRHASPFEHNIIAFEWKKEKWIELLSKLENPTVQVYYSNGFVFLNLRNAINVWELLPDAVKERIKEAFPTTYGVIQRRGEIEDEELYSLPYTKDKAYVKEKIETSSGWIGLVDKLELETDMDFYTFVVECPLFVARQWMRHRFGSYNEVSKRYVGKEFLEFYLPKYIRKQAEKNKQASVDEPISESEVFIKKIENLISKSVKLYEEIIEKGGAKELARGVLPQFMKTRFYWTVPRISLDNFITLRTHEGAQKEIREFAEAIKEMVGYRGTDKKNVI